jgi:hypothetical protein
MSSIPTHWKPELEKRIYFLELTGEEHQRLLNRHERESFLDFADSRGAVQCSLDLQPHVETAIEYVFYLDDDTPENHAIFLSAIADFIAA